MDSKQKRSDVDEDFILMFSVVDENLSWYLEENIEKFCSDPDATKQHMENLDEEFRESNLMHCKSQDVSVFNLIHTLTLGCCSLCSNEECSIFIIEAKNLTIYINVFYTNVLYTSTKQLTFHCST